MKKVYGYDDFDEMLETDRRYSRDESDYLERRHDPDEYEWVEDSFYMDIPLDIEIKVIEEGYWECLSDDTEYIDSIYYYYDETEKFMKYSDAESGWDTICDVLDAYVPIDRGKYRIVADARLYCTLGAWSLSDELYYADPDMDTECSFDVSRSKITIKSVEEI